MSAVLGRHSALVVILLRGDPSSHDERVSEDLARVRWRIEQVLVGETLHGEHGLGVGHVDVHGVTSVLLSGAGESSHESM